MSEPTTHATRIDEPVPGVLHWTIHDERIDWRSDAYAVATDSGAVLIDPLPLAEPTLERLGRVREIVLTGGFHQRAAWSLRRRFGVPVRAPEGAGGLEQAPDGWFTDGDRLDCGLLALDRPGPALPHFVLVWRDRVLFCADLLMREGDGPLRFVPDEHQDDPQRTRESVRRCLELSAEVVCPAHGEPLPAGGAEALRQALALDAAAD